MTRKPYLTGDGKRFATMDLAKAHCEHVFQRKGIVLALDHKPRPMRRKRLNVKRHAGRFEFERVSKRYSCGAPYETGEHVLWIRTARGTVKGGGRCVAWCETWNGTRDARLGLGVYLPKGTPCNPVTIAKALRRELLAQLREAQS